MSNNKMPCIKSAGQICECSANISKSAFIIVECDKFEKEIKILKQILTEQGYNARIAEEQNIFSEDVFCTNICGPMIESSFVIVFIDPRKLGGKFGDNINVIYEYGIAKGIRKKLITLVNAPLGDLPFDIQGDYAISLTKDKWDKKVKDLIKKRVEEIEEINYRILPPLEENVLGCWENALKNPNDTAVKTVSQSLYRLSHQSKMADNLRIRDIINKLSEHYGKDHAGRIPILQAASVILFVEKDKTARNEFMEFIKPEIISALDSTNSDVCQEGITFVLRFNTEGLIPYLMNCIMYADETTLWNEIKGAFTFGQSNKNFRLRLYQKIYPLTSNKKEDIRHKAKYLIDQLESVWSKEDEWP